MEEKIISKDADRVKALLECVASGEKIKEIHRMGGLTNHSYQAKMEDGKSYAVRIPGDGTEEMINRKNEEISTRLACELGIDAQLLFFGDDGAKVTEYIHHAQTMNPQMMRESRQIRQVAAVLKKLHETGVDTGVPFEVFDMVGEYENIILKNKTKLFDDYESIRKRIMEIKDKVDREYGRERVPCHNDPLCENWVRSDEKIYLIDWEYAGMNDGMWDLADISIEGAYGEKEDRMLLESYMGTEKVDTASRKRFEANKLYVDLLWTLWAKTRVPFDGEPMERWAEERYERLKKNLCISW